MKAVEVLIEHGVSEERIIFINLVGGLCHRLGVVVIDSELFALQIASPEGLTTFCGKYPSLKVVRSFSCPRIVRVFLMSLQITGWIDQGLNEKAYIIPGLGDFGERRFVVLAFSAWTQRDRNDAGIARNLGWYNRSYCVCCTCVAIKSCVESVYIRIELCHERIVNK